MGISRINHPAIGVPPWKAIFLQFLSHILPANHWPGLLLQVQEVMAEGDEATAVRTVAPTETGCSGVGKCPNVSHHPTIGDISSPDICFGDVKPCETNPQKGRFTNPCCLYPLPLNSAGS